MLNLFEKVPSNLDVKSREEEEIKASHLSSGQIRRARQRRLNSQTKKARRNQVRAYFAAQREGATLRGHLQAAGVITYALPSTKFDPDKAFVSASWLVQRFGEVDGETGLVKSGEDFVRAALQAALNRWESINGLSESRIDWAVQEGVA